MILADWYFLVWILYQNMYWRFWYNAYVTGEIGKKYLKEYIADTEKLFNDFAKAKINEAGEIGEFPKDITQIFFDTAAHGKRIRGALVTLGYKVAGGIDLESILDTSLFVELLHAGLLVHDDIQDQADKRRGLTSVHKQIEQIGKNLGTVSDPKFFGQSMAILPGDLTFYYSWEKLLNGNFPQKNIIKAGKIYADYTIRVAHGQILDILGVETKRIAEKDILNVLRYKSAEYTGVLPLLAGAALGGLKDKQKTEALKAYGLAFGWAFQIQDDTLDLYATEEKLGKPIGGDLKEGKNTLFILHLSKHGTKKQKEFMKQVLGNRDITKADIEKMRKILKDCGSYDYVIDLGWRYVEEGKKHISKITDDRELQDIFESLIVYMMERTN